MRRPLQNILHINTNDLKGGAAKVALRLCEGQRDLKYHSNMLVGYKESELDHVYPFDLDMDRLNVHRFRENGLLDYEYRGSMNLPNNRLFQHSEVIHLHNLHGGYFHPYSLAKVSSAKPIVWTLHDMHAFTGHCAYSFDCDRWKTGCGHCPDLDTYARIRHDSTSQLWKDKQEIYAQTEMTIITPSLWLKKKAEQSVLKDHPIELIYNGIDIDTFKPLNREAMRGKWGIPKNKVTIGCVANGGSFADPRKGGYYIKQVLEILNQRSQNFLFVNIGSNNEAGEDQNFINTGYIDHEEDLAEIYSTLDIFLFPSKADNCPLVVMEALSCGVPVVTFNTGGIPELVAHGKTGFIGNAGDIEALVCHLMQLITDSELRKMFSIQAREVACQRFDHSKTLRLYEDLYHQLYENRSKGKTLPANAVEYPLPKVLIAYDPKGQNIGDSSTYQSIENLTYPNYKCVMGNMHNIDLNAEDAELVYFIEEGWNLEQNSLQMLLYNYKGEEVITFDMKALRKDGDIFYSPISAGYFIEHEQSLLRGTHPFLVLYQKKYFIKHRHQIIKRMDLPINRSLDLRANLLSADLQTYILGVLRLHAQHAVYIYGAGKHTTDLIENIDISKFNICGILDRNKELDNKHLGGIPIYHINRIHELSIDCILISSASYEEQIADQLEFSGISREKIIRIYNG
ncbi:glycosyltransferase [Marinicrinis sediminis]|uniref:Glycosyltransferase n=1 Tax=Marinicrinis sediminis TaxID=1652465 RepID=A0ABW5RAE6_9BACL